MLNSFIVIMFSHSRLLKKTDWSAAHFHHMTNTPLVMDRALQWPFPCLDVVVHISHGCMSSPTMEGLHFSYVTKSCPVWEGKELQGHKKRVPRNRFRSVGCLGVRYLPFRLLPAYTNLYIVGFLFFFFLSWQWYFRAIEVAWFLYLQRD